MTLIVPKLSEVKAEKERREALNHTPTPWTYKEDGEANQYCLIADGKWLMAILHNGEQLSEKQRANFAFVVRAVNSHDELVTALNKISNLHREEWSQAHYIARDALKAIVKSGESP